MKVLFLTGGIPHYFSAILNQILRRPDHSVVVVAPQKGKTMGKGVYEKTESGKFPVILLEEYKTFFGKFFFRNFREVLDHEKPDAIIVGWPYSLHFAANPFLSAYLERNNIALINKDLVFQVPKKQDAYTYYAQTPPVDENLVPYLRATGIIGKIKVFILNWLRSRFYRMVKAHAIYSEQGIPVLESYGAKRENIFVVRNSPETDLLLEAAKKVKEQAPIMPYNPHRIIHVGRLVKWKKTHLLIEALALLKDKFPTADLIIVGTGPEKEALQKLADEKQILHRVKFAGGVYEPEDLGKYLSVSAVYVLAGIGGLSINDAMCFEKPVIASVCDGTEDFLVRNGFNGYRFREDDVNDLAEKISQIFSTPGMTEQMGKNSLKIIREEVNIETVAEAYLKVFSHVKKLTP